MAFAVLVISFLSFLVVSAAMGRWLGPKSLRSTVVSSALVAAIPIALMHSDMFSYGGVIPEASLHPVIGYCLLGAVSGAVAVLMSQAWDRLGRRVK